MGEWKVTMQNGYPKPKFATVSQSAGKSGCRTASATSFLHKWLSRVLPLFLCCCASDTWRIAVYVDLMLLKTQCFPLKVKISKITEGCGSLTNSYMSANETTFNLCFSSNRISLCNRKKMGNQSIFTKKGQK